MAAAAYAAAHKDMKWLTFDVTGAFLQCTWTGEPLYIRLPNDTPAETVYMGESNLAGRLVRVDKAWYGLKESNRIFTEDFKTVRSCRSGLCAIYHGLPSLHPCLRWRK